MTRRLLLPLMAAVLLVNVAMPAAQAMGSAEVRLKDLARIEGPRENALVGYGIVVGLAGTGDSSRSRATLQSVANLLMRFGVTVEPEALNSRNVAAVTLTATLPAHANAGDRIAVNVASMGDARSLLGGTLVMAPLRGPDQAVYALAQGAVSVGGYRYDAFGNAIQKNHATVGTIPGGATIERAPRASVIDDEGLLGILLRDPDYTTASRIVEVLGDEFGWRRIEQGDIKAADAGRIMFRPSMGERSHLVDVMRRIENLAVQPDRRARIVVNERTGTVVSGGDVRIGEVTIAQGDLRVEISTDYRVSQPAPFTWQQPGARTAVVPDTEIRVEEPHGQSVSLPEGTRVADLVTALGAIRATPRDIISVLQGLREAGALHAELVIR